jgi:Spy/CpxP family protein refolding chaperone
MTKTLASIGIATLLLAGLASNAQAGERGAKAKGEGPKAGMPMGPMAELNLTAEQKKKIDQLHEAAAKQAEPLHKELAAKMKEMQALWAVDKPDKAAIERKHAEMSALNSKLWGIHIDTKLQIHALLTPEQRAKWANHPDMPPMMMHGPGMGGMHGGGCGMHGVDCPYMHGDCPCAHGGDCPCMHGAGAEKGAGAPAGDCPCKHGAGAAKGAPGAPEAAPTAPAAPGKPGKPEKK